MPEEKLGEAAPTSRETEGTDLVQKYSTVIMAALTLVLAFCSAMQTYYMRVALHDARNTFLNSQRTFIASQRPALTYVDDSPLIYKLGSETVEYAASMEIGYNIKNSGNSIAAMKNYAIWLCMSPCSGDKRQDIPHLEPDSGFIGPQSRTMYDISISPTELRSLIDKKKDMYIIFYAEYSDFLGSGNVYHIELCDQISTKQGMTLASFSQQKRFDDLFDIEDCNSNNRSD